MNDLEIANSWFNNLDEDKQTAIKYWLNMSDEHFDKAELILLHHHFNLGNIDLEQCSDCKTWFINTNGLFMSDWGSFQGVAYEGDNLYNYVHGHIEGDSPDVSVDVCIDCISNYKYRKNTIVIKRDFYN